MDLLFRETGWTERQMAQAVNRIGTERGTPTKYQQPSAHQWLKGCIPKTTTQPLILEALARRLGRPVTHDQAGFPARPDQSESYSLLEDLIDLGRQDMERRNFLGVSIFAAAMPVPAWAEAVERRESVRSGATQRVGMSDVELVGKMTEQLFATFNSFGGRYTRPMAATFMVDFVAPYLRLDGPPDVQRKMLSAAAYLCYNIGWMAVDEGVHGLAQRWYVKGLELAQAGGDRKWYSYILRGLSGQAVDLEHASDAVRFANSAAASSPETTPRLKAFMLGQQAHSFAVAGERTAALRTIRETERQIEKAESPPGPFGGYDPSVVAYHASQVRYYL
ncbi:tetratricopeptide repeat protein, partial [Streptomyces sp. NPDC058953]|uniref:tetratricopeptide repeat protein n=1 Tax=Streptomyces sp. NPDC058953 TaxID=3346676 RepID=UPI003696C6C3